MERLSSLDGVFLAVEDRVNQMNIGTVAIFDGPGPPLAEVRGFLAGRHRVGSPVSSADS